MIIRRVLVLVNACWKAGDQIRWGKRIDIDGLRHWVTIGLYVTVSGPVHEQCRLLWGKP